MKKKKNCHWQGTRKIFYKIPFYFFFSFYIYLKNFLEKHGSEEKNVYILGAGSNTLFRDPGFDGVIIKLGKTFAYTNLLEDNKIEVGAATLDKTISEMAGKEYSFLKKKLTEVLISELTPVGKEVKKLLEDKSHLKNILKKGSEKANIIAEENLKNIREKVGLI